jgi:SAM-dependent methyltransferase
MISRQLKTIARDVCPEKALALLRAVRWRRDIRRSVRQGQVPSFADFVGYETLVKFLLDNAVERLAGDFVEIGAFLGGGTAKLAKLARSCGKKVWVIDIFDPAFDQTETTDGRKMNDLYKPFVKQATQEDIFRWITEPFARDLRVLKSDSRDVVFSQQTQFCFGFIDGNHDPAWVENDFRLVWKALVPGGWIGFHDYGGDLPQVTSTIDRLVNESVHEIARTIHVPEKTIILISKKLVPSR